MLTFKFFKVDPTLLSHNYCKLLHSIVIHYITYVLWIVLRTVYYLLFLLADYKSIKSVSVYIDKLLWEYLYLLELSLTVSNRCNTNVHNTQ